MTNEWHQQRTKCNTGHISYQTLSFRSGTRFHWRITKFIVFFHENMHSPSAWTRTPCQSDEISNIFIHCLIQKKIQDTLCCFILLPPHTYQWSSTHNTWHIFTQYPLLSEALTPNLLYTFVMDALIVCFPGYCTERCQLWEDQSTSETSTTKSVDSL